MYERVGELVCICGSVVIHAVKIVSDVRSNTDPVCIQYDNVLMYFASCWFYEVLIMNDTNFVHVV